MTVTVTEPSSAALRDGGMSAATLSMVSTARVNTPPPPPPPGNCLSSGLVGGVKAAAVMLGGGG